jgi:RimJ/RimL family protein N-acetyltransferase
VALNAPGRQQFLPHFAGRVVLRRLAVSDLRDFQQYRSDPLVGRYQGWTAGSDADATAFLAEMSEAPLFRPERWSQIGIADRVESRLLGDIGIFLCADGRGAEIGFTLGRESQGRGLGATAVRAALDLLFEHTDVERVLGITDARNHASIRLLQRVGMHMTEARAAMFRDEACIEHVYALGRERCAQRG